MIGYPGWACPGRTVRMRIEPRCGTSAPVCSAYGSPRHFQFIFILAYRKSFVYAQFAFFTILFSAFSSLLSCTVYFFHHIRLTCNGIAVPRQVLAPDFAPSAPLRKTQTGAAKAAPGFLSLLKGSGFDSLYPCSANRNSEIIDDVVACRVSVPAACKASVMAPRHSGRRTGSGWRHCRCSAPPRSGHTPRYSSDCRF